jgi:3-oxoacyl-[acyl-carrier-protein] synthase-3
MYATFKSIGAYVPSEVLDNKYFEGIVETSDEWIVKRTGIKERRRADKSEFTSDMATQASLLAIKRAGLKAEDIDCIVLATITPDYLCMPSTACLVAEKLGIKNIMAFDISAACTGFIYAIQIAKSFIESNLHKNVLVIGAEKLSSIVDYEDRTTCVLFGDGAGAAVIGATEDKSLSIIDVNTASDGVYEDLLKTPSGGCRNPIGTKGLSRKDTYMQMKGNEIFKIAVRTLANDVKEILQKNNLTSQDIDYFIPHQANLRIISAVGSLLDFSEEQTVLTVSKYGNTSAASIPMALNDAYEDGRITNGKTLLLDAFGGGLTWGSCLFKFNGN